jgi:hypothetical protein
VLYNSSVSLRQIRGSVCMLIESLDGEPGEPFPNERLIQSDASNLQTAF